MTLLGRFRPMGHVKSLCSSRNMSSIESNKITVDNKTIHYVRTGSGDHPLLLLPGALGAAESDFHPQLENLSKDKFTLIGWDPPGYGQSRPPSRNWDNFFENDARMAVETMHLLGFQKFSMLGWSDGGITSLIAAARFPESILKCVVFGSNAYLTQGDIDMVSKVKDVSAWSERMRKPMDDMYGEEFPKLWAAWCAAYENFYYQQKGDICCGALGQIRAPTFIIYGAKDVMVDPVHVDHLRENIKGSKSYTFPDGKHNLHFKYQKEFNKLVEEFLQE